MTSLKCLFEYRDDGRSGAHGDGYRTTAKRKQDRHRVLAPDGEILQRMVQFGGAIIGIALIVTGLIFVMRIFGVIAMDFKTSAVEPGHYKIRCAIIAAI